MTGIPRGGTPRSSDRWSQDVSGAKEGEAFVRRALNESSEISAVDDLTTDMGSTDFRVRIPEVIDINLKEKRSRYTSSFVAPAKGVPQEELFCVDEVYLRRAFASVHPFVLLVHDLTERRWLYYSMWTLLVAPKVRFEREIKWHVAMLKGKVFYRISVADRSTESFDVGVLVGVARSALAGAESLGSWRLGDR